MISTAHPRPTPAPEITIIGGRLPLSPAAVRAAARLLLVVARQRRERAEAGDDQHHQEITP